ELCLLLRCAPEQSSGARPLLAPPRPRFLLLSLVHSSVLAKWQTRRAGRGKPMTTVRATTARALLCALLLAAAASSASAQPAIAFPTRPVKILVPFAAGGPTDVVARTLADLLSARWNGQSVVIENRPGAGTIVATAAVGKSPADGYTMLIGTNSFLINPAIGQ